MGDYLEKLQALVSPRTRGCFLVRSSLEVVIYNCSICCSEALERQVQPWRMWGYNYCLSHRSLLINFINGQSQGFSYFSVRLLSFSIPLEGFRSASTSPCMTDENTLEFRQISNSNFSCVGQSPITYHSIIYSPRIPAPTYTLKMSPASYFYADV